MAWITLSINDVKTRLAGAEVEALQEAALAVGQADPLPEIIRQAIIEVRGYVAACRENTLGAGDTIPEELKSAALDLIRHRVCTRLPVQLLTEERKEEYRNALTLLRDAAACRFTLEQPATASTAVLPSPKPSIKSRPLSFDRQSQDGV